MKKFSLLVGATLLFLGACTKQNMNRNTAQITGYDTRTCECCGGFMVKITDDKDAGNFVTKELPADAGINQYSTFPINVEIDYTKNKENCTEVITVSRVRKL